MSFVIKRDGRREVFDCSKIAAAVTAAADSVGVRVPTLKLSFDKSEIPVDEIHDTVERQLMKINPAVAKAYILYRQKRSEVRQGKTKLMQKIASLTKETSRDNANTGTCAASKMYGIAEAVAKEFNLSNMTKKHADNHRKGRIYIHDLGYYSVTFNCFFPPIGKMLQQGFDNGVGTIRPPKRIGSAMALTAIILQSSQNDFFGGQGVFNFDFDMAPFVKAEYQWQLHKLQEVGSVKDIESEAWIQTEKATFQACEALVYNLNTMRSRSGAQVPFTSLNFGLDTSREGRVVSRNILKAFIAGLGNGENPVFPNLCYRLLDGVNTTEGDPNYDITRLAVECVGKRIQPRFVFCNSPAFNGEPYNASAMGCRTAVRTNVNGSNNAEGRGNLAFNTLNLPYFALEANGDFTAFIKVLDEAINDAIDELLERYDVIKNLRAKDVPFIAQWYQGGSDLAENDRIEPMVKNGSLSVGFIGLAECLHALIGKHHGESADAQCMGLKIISRIKKATDAATKKYHLNFSTFATPAESACYTLLMACRKEFGIVPGVTDKDYLTNSFHIPVSYQCDMQHKINIEAPYHLLCNAGAIFYIEAPSSPKWNPEGIIRVLRYINHSGIVYGGINFENDYCRDCGYTGTFDGVCPHCGGTNIRVVKIITGYLSTTDRFNDGKRAEAADRISHTGGGAL